MGAYVRQGGNWVPVVLRRRDGADWTGVRANGYSRVGGTWVRWQPGPAGDMLPPQNLAVAATDRGATITWTNPPQAVTPTDVQFRILNLTTIWTEYGYPTTTVLQAGLDPETTYHVQVRYVRRVDGVIVDTSPIAERFFTTLAPASPGVPAEDPGGSGSESIITWPFTFGTPGAVGGPNCWWEYVVQELDLTYIWVDTLVTDEIAGNIGDLQVDPVVDWGFPCNTVLRLKFREVCNGVPQAWQFGGAFVASCDWANPCAGTSVSPSFSTAPYTDATYLFPRVCVEDSGVRVRDHISNQPMTLLSGYNGPLRDPDTEWNLLSRAHGNAHEPVFAGPLAALATWDSTTDFTLSFSIKLTELDLSARLWRLGGLLYVNMFPIGAGWGVSVAIPNLAGGYRFLTSGAVELAFDEYHSIAIRVDHNGNKDLWLNGVKEDEDLTGFTPDLDAMTSMVELNLPPTALARKIGAWDRLLSPAEIAALEPTTGALSGPFLMYNIQDIVNFNHVNYDAPGPNQLTETTDPNGLPNRGSAGTAYDLDVIYRSSRVSNVSNYELNAELNLFGGSYTWVTDTGGPPSVGGAYTVIYRFGTLEDPYDPTNAVNPDVTMDVFTNALAIFSGRGDATGPTSLAIDHRWLGAQVTAGRVFIDDAGVDWDVNGSNSISDVGQHYIAASWDPATGDRGLWIRKSGVWLTFADDPVFGLDITPTANTFDLLGTPPFSAATDAEYVDALVDSIYLFFRILEQSTTIPSSFATEWNLCGGWGLWRGFPSSTDDLEDQLSHFNIVI